jgi:transcriptional regulator with XRE-family HTH domain
MTLIDRIIILIKEKGISERKMLIDNDINHSAMHNWRNRGHSPSGETIAKLADYFGVSVDYLLGREAPPEFTPEQRQLALIIADLSDSDRQKALDYIDFLGWKSKKACSEITFKN